MAIDLEGSSSPGDSPKARLAELIALVVNTAKTKGWQAVVAAEDKSETDLAAPQGNPAVSVVVVSP